MSLKRHAITGALAALALAAATAGAFAASAYASTNVNVRSGPGPAYRVVDNLRRGERVEIDYCRGSWCFVVKPGPDGWVSSRYLETGRPRKVDPWFHRPRPGYGWGYDHYYNDEYGYGRPYPEPYDPYYDNRSSACFGDSNSYVCLSN